MAVANAGGPSEHYRVVFNRRPAASRPMGPRGRGGATGRSANPMPIGHMGAAKVDWAPKGAAMGPMGPSLAL